MGTAAPYDPWRKYDRERKGRNAGETPYQSLVALAQSFRPRLTPKARSLFRLSTPGASRRGVAEMAYWSAAAPSGARTSRTK